MTVPVCKQHENQQVVLAQ